MKLFLLSIILAIIIAFVAATPECSFTCDDGVKVFIPNINDVETCKMAVELLECPARRPMPIGQCIPWCPTCHKCHYGLEITNYSFIEN
ncbi:hypothetical protein DFA_06122 [Cavenderia fasciculata]|uniref:Uncharacterized protein n=1 Tax=Cavenderia fasciculata TaxID=261658 RepID=F4PK60_CACFS|nr:uncharacterized protein DFA_06122 [Cavenderia fasciculata]EGG23984.1 hypothetical protein DFA_06122 [Cavenderia fasciculata]|eukprot:XP_004361835.1 hypothetical protein DFA_06122 [Cavenderia fasciculata]